MLREKEIAVANHIRSAAFDGCQCEPCIACREAHGAPREEVRTLVAKLRKRDIAESAYKDSQFWKDLYALLDELESSWGRISQLFLKRPSVPEWSHGQSTWIYDGKRYDDPYQADHVWSIDLARYTDELEAALAATPTLRVQP